MNEAAAALVALGATLELRCTLCEGNDLHVQARSGRATVYCVGCNTIYRVPYARNDALESLLLAQRNQTR